MAENNETTQVENQDLPQADREEKLPKWAKELLGELRAQVTELEEAATAPQKEEKPAEVDSRAVPPLVTVDVRGSRNVSLPLGKRVTVLGANKKAFQLELRGEDVAIRADGRDFTLTATGPNELTVSPSKGD